jgi:hypothetical protein
MSKESSLINLVLDSSLRCFFPTNPSCIHPFQKNPKRKKAKVRIFAITNESNKRKSEKKDLERDEIDEDLKGLGLEMLRQSSFSVEGVCEKAKPKLEEAIESLIDLLKHQFVPLIGNTTNFALMFSKIL